MMIYMSKYSEFFKRYRDLVLAVLATIVMIVYAQFVLGHFSKCFLLVNGHNSLGLTFGYSQSQILSFFNSREIDQLFCYGRFIRVWDTVFPVIYTAMYILWIRFFFKNKNYLLILPLIRMLTDWAENYTELNMLEQYLNTGNISDDTAFWGSGLTLFKWGLSLLIYLMILLGITIRIIPFLKRLKPF